MKNLTTILIACIFISGKIQAEIITDSIRIDGNQRSFHFIKPEALTPGASLVFVLHGSGGNGIDMMKSTTKMAQRASSENTLLVYPNGYKKYWNECRKAASSLANKENINEEAFFIAMIDYFRDKYKINDRQVFAIGTSGGGHMCYKLALTIPQKFRAIAAIIANLPDDKNLDCIEAGVAIPAMIINGTDDPVNPYGGGMMKGGNFVMGTVRSTEMTFQYWARLAGYSGEPVKENIPDNDKSDGKTIERYTYEAPGKPEVVLLKVIGGKHDYPNDIEVHIEGLEFFRRQLKK